MSDLLITEVFSSFTYNTWWIAGVILMFSEIFVGGAFLLWLGISALMVGGILFLGIDLSWQLQWIVFSVMALLSILVWRRFYKRKTEHSEDNLLSRRADKYIGRSFVVAEAIENGVGKVKVEDTLWRALGEDTPVGTLVKVTGVEGASLQVV